MEKNDFFPYLWFLSKIDDKIEIDYEEYNPYFEISSVGINAYNEKISINLSMLGINDIIFDKKVLDYQIKVLSKIIYSLMINKMYLSLTDDYYISKWKYKSKYIKDKVYIFTNCIKDSFENTIIYYDNFNFLILLDYEKNLEIEEKIKNIILEFLPIGFECKYVFNNFLMLDIKEISQLEEWVLL